MALFLGLDLGTSYFKAGLFDQTGRLAGLGRVSTPVSSPASGRYEINVPDFWRALRGAVAEAMKGAGASPADVRAISYSSQANTFVLLDAAGEPLTPLIVWTDQRAAPLDESLAAFGSTDHFLRTVGFAGLSPQFAAAKWRYLCETEPALVARTARVATISDYLIAHLTGTNAGDSSTAALTGAWDLNAARWWPEALQLYRLSSAQLSSPVRPGTPVGTTTAAAQAALDLRAGIPFAAGALDHYAAAVGAGIGQFSPVTISIGTVLAAVRVGGFDVKRGVYVGPTWQPGEFYHLAFSSPGAVVVEEYRARVAPATSYDQLLRGACESPSSHRDYRELRDIINGLAQDHGRLLRSLGDGEFRGPVLATGGGARNVHWLQLVADALRQPVTSPATAEVACLGAAIFGAAANGDYRDVAAASQAMCRAGETLTPRQ